jgi:hypothetical protein
VKDAISSVEVNPLMRQCAECLATLLWDGSDQALLRFNRNTAYTLEPLHQSLTFFLVQLIIWIPFRFNSLYFMRLFEHYIY